MKLTCACAVSVMVVAACRDQGPQPTDAFRSASAPTTEAATMYCGGQTTTRHVAAYFNRLAEHLAAESESVPMEFYDETFGVSSIDGESLFFDRAEMKPGARALPSLEDWREISRRGAERLHGAGYRGCFLAHGKVWFEADAKGQLALTFFAKDMPWDELPS